jgi:hypothetical protein
MIIEAILIQAAVLWIVRVVTGAYLEVTGTSELMDQEWRITRPD